MADIATDIAGYISNQTLTASANGVDEVIDLGKNLFVGNEPSEEQVQDGVNGIVTIYSTGGPEQDARLNLDTLTFQVRSKSQDYDLGYALLDEIKKELQSIDSFLYNNKTYIGIWSSNPITFIEIDDNQCSIFTANFRAIVSDSDAGNRN